MTDRAYWMGKNNRFSATVAYVRWALPWFHLKRGAGLRGYVYTWPRLLVAFWRNRPR